VATIVERLTAIIGGDISAYETAMTRVTRIADQVSAKMVSAGRKGMFLFGGLGIAALKYANDFDKAMGEVDTITDLSAASMAETREQILSMADAMGKDATELAKGYYQTISSGITDTAEAMKVMQQATELSIAGMTKQETALDVMTSVMNAYTLSAKDAERISDILFTTVRLGKTRLGDLGRSLGRVLPIAAQNKVAFEELNAALVAGTLVGLSTEEATTGLRSMMVQMIKPTEEATKYAEELGIAWGREALNAKGLFGMLDQLRLKSKEVNLDMATLIPNIRALPLALALVGSGAEKAADALAQLKNASGETGKALDKQNKRFWREMQSMWSRVKITLIELGTTLMPMVKEWAKAFGNVAKKTSEWVKKNQKLASSIVKWGFALSAGLFILGKFIAAASGIAKFTHIVLGATRATKLYSVALGGLGRALNTLPGKVVIAVAIAYAGYKTGNALYRAVFEPVLDWSSEIDQRIQETGIRQNAAVRQYKRAQRQLGKAGYSVADTNDYATIKKTMRLYDLWASKRMEAEQQLIRSGATGAEARARTSKMNIEQLNSITAAVKALHAAEAARIQEVTRLGMELAARRKQEANIVEQTTSAMRTYYGELKANIEDYKSKIDGAIRKEEELANRRRSASESMRATLFGLKTSRMDDADRRKAMKGEAKRSSKLAQEAGAGGNIRAAEEYRRRAAELYRALATEQISEEKRASSTIQRLLKERVELRKAMEGGSNSSRTMDDRNAQRLLEIDQTIAKLKDQYKTSEQGASTAIQQLEIVLASGVEAIEQQQATAKAATDQAKQNLLDMQAKVTQLQTLASSLKIDLDTESAEAAVKRLSVGLMGIRAEITALYNKRNQLLAQPSGVSGGALAKNGKGPTYTPATTVNNKQTVNIEINGITEPKEVAEKVADILERRERRRQ
jgi:TP901 family phage tail tape measure protein